MASGKHSAKHAAASPEEKPKRSARRIFSNVLLALGIVLLLVAGGMWGFSQWRYYESAKSNERLASYVELPEVSEQESEAPKVDWAGLKAVNDDVVGWLYIPGTTINYPVYQGEDNEYYLRHSAEGEWIIAGQLFLDAENAAPGMVDQQSIIYGHHLLDGSMFEQIAALDDQAKFDEIDTIWYVTEAGAWEMEPLLLYYTDPYDQDVRQFSMGSDEEFRSYLRGLLDKSVTHRSDADQVIGVTSHVLTMSTCNYYDGYGRTIYLCVPKAEAALATSAS